MTKLYEFAISHYCEKARWALDHHALPFKRVQLIPGPHILTTKRLAPKTGVPILTHDGKTIQESAAIISYLDEVDPEKSLTPTDSNLRKEAIELEKYCDFEIGPHLRRYFYNTLLDRPKEVVPLLLQSGPWYGPCLYKIIFPKIRSFMRQSMRINPESAERSKKRLTDAMDNLSQKLIGKKFLIGNKFSRADVAAASLLAPLCRPINHPFKWIGQLPEPLESFHEAHKNDPIFKWVLEIYATHR